VCVSHRRNQLEYVIETARNGSGAGSMGDGMGSAASPITCSASVVHKAGELCEYKETRRNRSDVAGAGFLVRRSQTLSGMNRQAVR
jgi:hypothetical protein